MSEENVVQKIAAAIGTYAPSVASILAATGVGAPAGAVVGAIGAIARAFGMPEGSQAEEVLKKIETDPEAYLKLKAAENEFKLGVMKEENEKLRIEIGDIQNAREREKTTKDSVNRNLAYAIITAFIIVVLVTLAGWTKVESVLAGTLIGYLSAKAEQVLAYYFGSSKGSTEKTNMIFHSTPTEKK